MASNSEQARAALRLRKHEGDLEKIVAASMRRAWNQVLQAADEAPLPSQALVAAVTGPDDLAGFLAIWRNEVDGPIAKAILSVYRDSARSAVANVPGLAERLGPEFFDTVRNVRADLFLAQRKNLIVGAGQDTFDSVIADVQAGLEAGEGVPKVAKRIRNSMEASLLRATTIARTEAGSAVNAADHSVAEELLEQGVITGRQWLATGDDRTRDTHVAADGQVVYGDKRFQVGDTTLAYPGDSAGSAKETINCRCTTLLILAEDDPNAPANVKAALAAQKPDSQFAFEGGGAKPLALPKASDPRLLSDKHGFEALNSSVTKAPPAEVSAAARRYQRENDAAINDRLRAKPAIGSRGDISEDIRTLRAYAYANPTKSPILTYRGVKGDWTEQAFPPGQSVGLEFTETGFSSTTTSKTVADKFGLASESTKMADPTKVIRQKSIVMRVLVPEGTPAIPIDQVQRGVFEKGKSPSFAGKFNEKEMLLPDGVKYRVLADYEKDGQRYLDVEVVDVAKDAPIPDPVKWVPKPQAASSGPPVAKFDWKGQPAPASNKGGYVDWLAANNAEGLSKAEITAQIRAMQDAAGKDALNQPNLGFPDAAAQWAKRKGLDGSPPPVPAPVSTPAPAPVAPLKAQTESLASLPEARGLDNRDESFALINALVKDLPSRELQEAAARYQGSSYRAWNNALRGLPGGAMGKANADALEQFKRLVTQYTVPRAITAYRGVKGDWVADAFPRNATVGKTFTDDGFSSVSVEEASAREYAGKRDAVIFRVSLKKGDKALPLDAVQGYTGTGSFELVLPHGTKYTVTRDYEVGGWRYLDVEVDTP